MKLVRGLTERLIYYREVDAKVTGVLWGFKTEYRVDSGKNFLVLSKDGLESGDILGFQVEMLANNNIPGIVQIQIREKNAELEIYYDLTGLVSLRNHLKRQCISKVEFIRLLEGMVSVLSDGCRYYLDSSSFVFNEDFIYLNPVTKDVFLIYIPAGIQQDTGQSFKTMVVNTLICSANIDTADNFVQKLLKLFGSGAFNPGEFCRHLKTIDVDHCSSMNRETATAGIRGDAGSTGINGPPGLVNTDMAAAAGVSCELQPLDTTVTGAGKNTRTIALAALAVIAVTGAILSNIYNSIGSFGDILADSQLTGYLPAGVLALLAAGGAVVWLVSSGKKSGRPPEEETVSHHAGLQRFVAEINQSEPEEKLDAYNVPVSSKVPDIANMPVPSNLPDAVKAPDEAMLTEETVLLGGVNFPFLMAVNGDETIVIDKPEFIIGRNEGACDYAIRDRSIGRAHARIKAVDNVYYILDMDSKNGTLINNTRILSSQQYELKHNDRVAFANVEYCFRVK